MKKVLGIYGSPRGHWVGDGFPVRSLFSYDTLRLSARPAARRALSAPSGGSDTRSDERGGHDISPFLLLDYAGPAQFDAATAPRGVGQHPHRGFETVTIVYQGEVAHRDSTGNGGVIGPGDVQWMTAASGILHEEFHSPAFTERGGVLEMVQLWVNLPARDKLAAPGYQAIVDGDIAVVPLPADAGSVRVIAGSYAGRRGPARTFTPINVWDLRLAGGHGVELTLPAGHTAAVVVLHGAVRLGGGDSNDVVREAQMALLARDGERLALQADSDATLLVLTGEPIDEPIVGQGPFVMNTRQEIVQAIEDFNAGRFGQMAH